MMVVRTEVEIPEGIKARLEGTLLKVEGPAGRAEKTLENPRVTVGIAAASGSDNGGLRKIVIEGHDEGKKTKSVVNSFESHVKNLLRGVQHGFRYELEIVQSHFPIKLHIDAAAKDIRIENFVGEKKPRHSQIKSGVTVKTDGKSVTVEGADLEQVAQTAGSLECATRVVRKDRRRYQDGIYLMKKKGIQMVKEET